MKKNVLLYAAALAVAGFACQSNSESEQTEAKTDSATVTLNVGQVPVLVREQKKTIANLEHAQSVTTNVDSMFLYDSVIGAAKQKGLAIVNEEFAKLQKPISVPFTQTANTDKIQIVDLHITAIKDLNEMEIEAQVKALANSAFDSPFAGLTANAESGKKLDIGGGIGVNTKLVAGQTYTFKGTIYNYSLLDSTKSIQFDEDFKKW